MAVIIGYTPTQYSGSWSLSSQANAKALGTWPLPPEPHLLTWGRNNTGQLGLGNTTYYSSPKQVGSLATWSIIYSSVNQTFVIKTDGTLWTWGWNNFGQLGLGNLTYYSSPKQVGALTNWSKVAGNIYYSVGIKTDGTLWAWGYGTNGQLGLGISGAGAYRSSPTQVGSLTNWANISTGYAYCTAVKTDGTLWSWGGNSAGQLGLNNTTQYSSPKQIGLLTNWLAVSCASYNNTVALKTDGTMWTWGNNNNGQLGLGNTTNYSSPKQVGALTTWSTVSMHSESCFALRTGGTLWSWGANNYGQLGQGNITNLSSPVQVGALTTWLTLSLGYSTHVGLIKTDGTLWTWGRNNAGQLGLGNTTNYSSPKQVGSLTGWSAIATGTNSSVGIALT